MKNAHVVVCPGPEAPRKGKEPPARYVEVVFDKASAREIRVRPEGDETAARITEVEIDVQGKKRSRPGAPDERRASGRPTRWHRHRF